MHRYARMAAAGLLAALLLLPRAAAAQEPVAAWVSVMEAGADDDRAVRLRIGVYDAQDRPISNLQGQEVSASVNGQPITVTMQLEPRAPAVAVVADASAAMGDQSAPGQGRVQAMVSQIHRARTFLAPDAPLTLITFDTAARVAVPWEAGETLTATLDSLLGQPPPAAVADAPYALTEAILLGLDQLGQPDGPAADRLRALLVYAAGAPQREVDIAAVQQRLARLGPNPPLIVFVGLGSGTPGQFAAQPGNPESLTRAAGALPHGAYQRFFTGDPGEVELLQRALDAHVQQVAGLEQLYTLRLAGPALAPGFHQIELAVHGITVTHGLRVPVAPPQITLAAPERPLRDGDTLSVEVTFAQQPVEAVAYYLDGEPIGVSTAGPNYPLTLDLARYGEAFEATAPHELAAVATDAAGLQSQRSAARLLFEPPPPATAPAAADGPARDRWLLAVVAALALVVLLMLGAAGGLALTPVGRRLLASLARAGDGAQQAGAGGRGPGPIDTIHAGALVSGQTELVSAAGGAPTSITVVEGEQRRSFPLPRGRQVIVGRGPGPEISLDNQQVSSRHARIELVAGGVRLIDLGSRNGTFVGAGERRRRLAPNTPELLQAGESFWVGPGVKLLVQ